MAVCTCSNCSRVFEVSDLYKKLVEFGKLTEVLCGYCDNSHNDGEYDTGSE